MEIREVMTQSSRDKHSIAYISFISTSIFSLAGIDIILILFPVVSGLTVKSPQFNVQVSEFINICVIPVGGRLLADRVLV